MQPGTSGMTYIQASLQQPTRQRVKSTCGHSSTDLFVDVDQIAVMSKLFLDHTAAFCRASDIPLLTFQME